MNEPFYLTLPSNSSTSYFSENKTTKYSTQLPKQINLKGLWEVALVEIHYPCSFLTVTEDENNIYIYTHNVDTDTHGLQFTKLDPGTYDSAEKLVESLNKNSVIAKYLRFVYFNKTRHVTINALTKDVASIELSPTLTLQLGFDPNSSDYLEKSGPRPCNVYLGIPAQMYVYCDVIEPQLIGDVMAPLLRIINVDSTNYKYGASKTFLFTKPHYVPVMLTCFENLELDLRTDSGKPVPFNFGTLCVKLHFRPKRYESS